MKVFIKKLLTAKTARKVPEVTIFFWIIKLLTTAMGESTSDFMVHTIDPVIAVCIGFAGFIISVVLQFWVHKYVAWVYWLTVTMVAIFGTMAADVVHIVLGVPYWISTLFFAGALAIVFFIWRKIEHTLSIHSIFTFRRELFYWMCVIFTFALGTAAGDMTAITFHLGYFVSGILFAALFALPLFIYKMRPIHEVLTFWAAYIVTRPFGASFADLIGRTNDVGGIGVGTGKTTIILGTLIILLVIYISITRLDTQDKS